MLVFSLLFFSVLQKQNFIFLPPAIDECDPYECTVSFSEKNLAFSMNNSDFLKISEFRSNNLTTDLKLRIFHDKKTAVSAEIEILSEKNKSRFFQVFITPVYSTSLKISYNRLYSNQTVEIITVLAQDYNKNFFDFIPDYLIKFSYNEGSLTINKNISTVPLPESSYFIVAHESGKQYIYVSVANISSKSLKIYVSDKVFVEEKSMRIPLQESLCDLRVFTTDPIKREVDLSNFNITTTNPNVLVFSRGLKPLKEGDSDVVIQLSPSERNYIVIKVTVANAVRAEGKKQWLTVGKTPSFKEYEIFDSSNNKCWTPSHKNLVIGSFDQNTEGIQKIEASIYNISFTFEVNFCRKISTPYKSARLPVGHSGFVFDVLGGSGKFSFEIENQSVASVNEKNEITTKASGKTLVSITDVLTKSHTKCFVKVEDILSARFNMTRFEMRVGEKINITYFGLGLSGKKFTYFEPDIIYSSNQSVISSSFVCVGPGFARIKMQCGDSNATELFSVIETFSTISSIRGLAREKFDLKMKGGPQHWRDAEPPVLTLACGELDVPVINGMISFNATYKGKCLLRIANDPTENNPVPLVDTSSFNVDVIKVYKTAIAVIDDSNKNKKCGMAKTLKQSDASSFLRMSRIYITNFRIPTLLLYMFDENLNEIGVYKNAKISALLQNGKTVTAPLKKPITDKVTFYFSHNFLPSTSIIVEPFQNITAPEEITLMKECDNISNIIGLNIRGGSSQYSFINNDNGTVIVKDKCVPEFSKAIKVNYSKPKTIRIVGKKQCALGKGFLLSLELYDENGNLFNNNSIKCCNPSFNGIPTNNGTFYFIATKKGTFNITASACGLKATHSIYVYEKLRVKKNNITAFPGQRVEIDFSSGPSSFATFISYNKSIVTHDLITISPGTTRIKAFIEGRTEFGSVNITITVLNVTEIVIKPSVEYFIENSYVKFRAFAIIDNDYINIPYVHWTSDFPISVVGNEAVAYFSETGNFYVGAEFNKIHGSYEFSVDKKLIVEPTATIPLGTYHTIVSNGECSPNTFYGEKEGIFNVMCRRNKQSSNATIVVKKPSALRVFQDGKYVRTSLLNEYGQPFSTYNGTKISVNATSKETEGMFLIEPKTRIHVTESSDLFNLSSSLYVVDSFMSPTDVLMKGDSGKFTCSTPQKWISSNKKIIRVSKMNGKYSALATGVSYVECSEHNKAKITVTELEGIEVDYRSDTAIIKPFFKHFGKGTHSLLKKISCSCDATTKCSVFQSYFTCPKRMTNITVTHRNIKAPILKIEPNV